MYVVVSYIANQSWTSERRRRECSEAIVWAKRSVYLKTNILHRAGKMNDRPYVRPGKILKMSSETYIHKLNRWCWVRIRQNCFRKNLANNANLLKFQTWITHDIIDRFQLNFACTLCSTRATFCENSEKWLHSYSNLKKIEILAM